MTDGIFSHRASNEGGHPRDGRLWRVIVVTIFLLLFAGFMALGIWQVQRLSWKLALIERVETRIHSAPVDVPAPDVTITRDSSEYLRVKASGRFRSDQEVVVKAVTELGAGWWVLTPLETSRGFTVLVNRGFVPAEMKNTRPTAPEAGEVVGLLRISEPRGGFLRENDPAGDNWFSRDVPAIASAKGLTPPVAPYFIDTQPYTDGPQTDFPRAGMTVVKFANSHLVYAMTWFGLAAGSLVGMVLVLRERRRRQRAEV